MYPTNVPYLHEFCAFSVAHLKIVIPHLKLEQLATVTCLALYPPEIRGAAKILSRHRLAPPREIHSSRDDFFQKLSKSHNYYFIS